jgi:hypothetical protein
MNEQASQPEITADAKTGMITIKIETDFGPVTFSFSPAEVEAGIAALAKDILRRSQNGERPGPTVRQLGLPDKLVNEAALHYEERGKQSFPLDAIEQFTAGSKAFARGTIEQFSDNLIPALLLMLDYLAAVNLVKASADSDPRWRKKVAAEHEKILKVLQDHLAASIQRLYPARDSDNSDSRL